MFTGLIQDLGVIKRIEDNNTGKEFQIFTAKLFDQLKLGDSVAVNGVCLTVVSLDPQISCFNVQVVNVSLQKSAISSLTLHQQVNLELALKLNDRLGGHYVQGHVGGTATVIKIVTLGENREITFSLPAALGAYFILEGSITIDGTSLTIAKLETNSFIVSIIPHTWHHTIFHNYQVGTIVNIEVDIIAKYVEKWLTAWRPKS